MMQMPGWEHLEGEIYVWQHSLNRMFLIILLWSLDLFFDPPATDLYENIKKVISRYKTTQLKPYVLDHLAVKSRLLIHIKLNQIMSVRESFRLHSAAWSFKSILRDSHRRQSRWICRRRFIYDRKLETDFFPVI